VGYYVDGGRREEKIMLDLRDLTLCDFLFNIAMM
jgi:hypothetical protein